jgi:hypothetical protein
MDAYEAACRATTDDRQVVVDGEEVSSEEIRGPLKGGLGMPLSCVSSATKLAENRPWRTRLGAEIVFEPATRE